MIHDALTQAEALDSLERAPEGVDPNEAAPDGETALVAACAKGFDVVAVTLFMLGADPGMLCSNGSSALSIATYMNSLTSVRMLLHHGGECVRQVAAQHGLEQLLHAARVGLEVHRLLTYAKQPFGCDPFEHWDHAIHQLRHGMLCEELTSWFTQHVEVGARGGHASARPSGEAAGSGTSSTSGTRQSASSTSQQAKPGFRIHPLMTLVCTGDVAGLRQALELGADVNATADNSCKTLLMVAAQAGQVEVVRLLLSTGNHCCDLEQRNAYDYTALHYASSSGHDGIVRQLIAAGSDVNALDYKDCTALVLACSKGHQEVIDSLLAAGADTSPLDCGLAGALRHATLGGRLSVIQALLEAGADINGGACATRSVMTTPLCTAATQGHLQVLQFLLSQGADPNLADASGMTALSLAQHLAVLDRSFQPICKALQQAGAKAAPSVQDAMRRVSAQQRLTMDVQATTQDLLNVLVPESLRQRALAQLAEVRRVLNASAGRTKRRGTASSSASSSAQGGPMAVVSAASASATAGSATQVIRSSEEADRIAAELLADEEAEKAKVQAAQAKRGKKAKQKVQAQAPQQASGVGIDAAGTSGVQQQQQEREQEQELRKQGQGQQRRQQEREQQQQQWQQPMALPQQQGLDRATSRTAMASASRACTAIPADKALTSPMAALSLGSAPAPFAPWPAASVAALNVQQQPAQQPGNASHHDDERYCVVCMDGPRCMVLVPCGHVVLCQACCEAVQETSNECPMCRCVIDVAVTLNL